jgi:hypothetical protein
MRSRLKGCAWALRSARTSRRSRVVSSALLHRLDSRFDARVGGEQDHQRVRVGELDAPQDVQPIAVRQFVVEQDQVDALLEAVDRFGGRSGFEHTIAFIPQPAGEGPSDQLLIVDNEHRGAHRPHEYTEVTDGRPARKTGRSRMVPERPPPYCWRARQSGRTSLREFV